MTLGGCGPCVCKKCLLWWSRRCPRGGCWDEWRARHEPWPGPVRRQWTDWDKPGEQAHWCRGGACLNSRISLAIYDQKARKYVLGIELDTDTLPPDLPHLERDIYKRDFLEAHGWRIMRVWCRDWWHNPVKVIDSIERAVKQPEKTV